MKKLLNQIVSELADVLLGVQNELSSPGQHCQPASAKTKDVVDGHNEAEKTVIKENKCAEPELVVSEKQNVTSEVHEADTCQPTVPVIPVQPPEQAAVITKPGIDVVWLREELTALSQHMKGHDVILSRIEEKLATNEQYVKLLEEQEGIIGTLLMKVREAEQKELTDAILKPLLTDMMLLFDTVSGAKQELRKEGNEKRGDLITNCLANLEAEILTTLSRYGISLIQEPTKQLSPSRQKVVGVHTPPPVQDGEVVAVIRRGFEKNGQVVRPEEVIVMRKK